MFYRLLLTIMLCATAVCFGQEHAIDFEEFQKEPSVHRVAVMHIAFGDVKLLSHMYGEALEEFKRSLTILKNSPEVEPFIEFFARFGMTVAYDNLGLHEECEQTIGSLFLLLYENGDDGDDEESSLLDELPRGSKTKQHFDFMRKIAGLASSIRVKNLLEGILEDMEEEMASELSFAPALISDADWCFASSQMSSHVQIKQCSFKKIWKKFNKVIDKIEKLISIPIDALIYLESFYEG